MTASSPLTVEIVSDVVCPWCVIGSRQLRAAADAIGVALDIRWAPFELNPQMPADGENLREHLAAKYGTTLEGSIAARKRLTEMGAALGFAFNYADDMRMWNTFRAHQLIDWAEGEGQADAVAEALFAAYFTHRQNLTDLDVLAATAEAAGLDGAAAKAALTENRHAEPVRAKQAQWLRRGVSAAPTMVFSGLYGVAGAQGVERYQTILTDAANKNAA